MVLVDTQAAATAINRKPMDIRNWRRRGKLTPRGKDYRGRTLYDLLEVCRIADTLNYTVDILVTV